jgi:hypothetical protein
MRRRWALLGALATVVALAGPAAPAGAAEAGVVVPRVDDVPAIVARVQASGARHVRAFVSWRALEPRPGTLGDTSHYDALVDRLRALGIETYFVVLQTPAWAGAADSPPPAGAYGDFMRRLAEHFRGRVMAYEVWNEPDFTAFWRGGASPAAYAALLRAGYAGVKSGDSGARVGVGGLVGNDFFYVNALYDAGAKGKFDFVGVHTDNDCNSTDPRAAIRDLNGRIERFSFTAYREVRQVMLDHGDDKPIWMTELGWSVARGRCPSSRSLPAGVSPSRQAAFLPRAYACLAADPYVEKASWFSLSDFGPEESIATRFGLVDFRGRRRAAFAAFQRSRAAAPNRRCGLQVDRSPPRLTLSAPRDGERRSHDLYYRASASDPSGVTTLTLLVDGRRVRVTGRTRLVGHWGRGWRALRNGPHAVQVRAVDRAHNVAAASVTVIKG